MALRGERDAATAERERLAARAETGAGWALCALLRGGWRRGLVITPAHRDRVAREIRATWPRADRRDRACAAGLAALAALARRRGCPMVAHLADALGLLPGPPLLRAMGLPGDAVARDRTLQQRADAWWEAAQSDDDDDDELYPRPGVRDVRDVADLAPPWTALAAGEREELLAAVMGGGYAPWSPVGGGRRASTAASSAEGDTPIARASRKIVRNDGLFSPRSSSPT